MREDGFKHLYGELRVIAERLMLNERKGHTLNSTSLVHEAFLRLRNRTAPEEKPIFLAWVSAEMRRILVDHARRRAAQRRGGGQRSITLNERIAGLPVHTLDILVLDDALQRLSQYSERQEQVIELRLFGGMTVQETATVLSVSERTVKSDFRFAIAWLRREIGIKGASCAEWPESSSADRYAL